MISTVEALEIIKDKIKVGATETILVKDALNRVVANDLRSLISMPPFRQSAMDGYAIRLDDFETDFLLLNTEVKAGDAVCEKIKKGEAVRIFTGAPVPENAGAVVMQEHVEVNEGSVIINEPKIKEHLNIRAIGEQIEKNQIGLPKGTLLTPGAIGFAISLGLVWVDVYKTPKIAITVTGNELQEAGKPLEFGQIYESNSETLKTALQSKGFVNVDIVFVKDDFESTKNQINDLKGQYDFLLFSGGISVGDYDFVGKSLTELSCEEYFYKVKQKPGKPLYFGKLGESYVFALPGNPAAALTCFYEYVFPALQLNKGKKNVGLTKINLPLSHEYNKRGDRAQFLKAEMKDGKVSLLDGQASSMLSAFSDANCFIFMDEEMKKYQEGDLVEVHLL